MYVVDRVCALAQVFFFLEYLVIVGSNTPSKAGSCMRTTRTIFYTKRVRYKSYAIVCFKPLQSLWTAIQR